MANGAGTGDSRGALLISQHWTCPCQPRVSVPRKCPQPHPNPPEPFSTSQHVRAAAATTMLVVIQSLVFRHRQAPTARCQCREGRALKLNYRCN